MHLESQFANQAIHCRRHESNLASGTGGLSLLHPPISQQLPVSMAVKCGHTISFKSVLHEQVRSTRGSPGLYQNQ